MSVPCSRSSSQAALDALCLFFCRLGVAGLTRRAPGTWGSAVAALLAPMWFLPLSPTGRALALAAVFLVGGIAAGRAERLLGRKDPPQVVVDELLGMWLTLLPFSAVSLPALLAGFALFRLFDIWKPGPVRASEHWMRGGFGVMLDDVLAGFMAMLCLAALRALGL